jgi:hypothetical protein
MPRYLGRFRERVASPAGLSQTVPLTRMIQHMRTERRSQSTFNPVLIRLKSFRNADSLLCRRWVEQSRRVDTCTGWGVRFIGNFHRRSLSLPPILPRRTPAESLPENTAHNLPREASVQRKKEWDPNLRRHQIMSKSRFGMETLDRRYFFRITLPP